MKTPRFWQSRAFLGLVLLPLAALYRIGAWLDRAFTRPRRAPIPVISVGNVTAGGAGKTPTTLALIPVLHALGYRPHILTRGYGGAALHTHQVTTGDAPHDVGDEALLLAQAAPTWVGRDRLAAAHAAAHAGANIVVCDDGLQHHSLHKDLSLLVLDGSYGLGNGWVLPAGPLREPLATALKRSDGVLCIGPDVQHMLQHCEVPVFHAALVPEPTGIALLRDRWLAFAGIARPQKFYDTLQQLGAAVVATRDFPDHYAYREKDLRALLREAEQSGARLITTTKDAVKLPAWFAAQVTVLPVTLQFAEPDVVKDFLAKRLAT